LTSIGISQTQVASVGSIVILMVSTVNTVKSYAQFIWDCFDKLAQSVIMFYHHISFLLQ